eukprot:6466382-Amphidinium_carterae.2
MIWSKVVIHFDVAGKEQQKCIRSGPNESLTEPRRGFLSKCYEQKSAPVKSLKGLIDKLGSENVEVQTLGAQLTIETFESICVSLQDRKASVKGWQRDNFVDQHTEAFGLLCNAVELQRKVVSDEACLRSVRLLEVRQLSGERRKVALCVRRLAKPLVEQQFYRSCITWYGDSVLGLGSGKIEAKSNLAKATEGRLVDRPCLFVAEQMAAEPAVAQLQLLLEELKVGAALEKTADRVRTYFDGDGIKIRTNAAVLHTDQMVLEPRFVPDVLLDGHRPTEAFATFGKPLVLGGCMYGWRYGEEGWNHHLGVGMVLWGITGTVSVMTVPMEAVLRSGGCALQLAAYLDGLSGQDASVFMTANAKYFKLAEGDIAWVPWGTHISMVTLTERSVALAVPWYAKVLQQRLPEAVQAELVKAHQAHLNANQTATNLQALMFWSK